MNTLEAQIDFRNILNQPLCRAAARSGVRALPVSCALGPTVDEQAKRAEAQWLRGRSKKKPLDWNSPVACARCLARDENCNVVNFPFAFATLGTLAAGFGAFLCGTYVESGWLAVGGFLTTLAGGLFYGWSTSD